MLLHDGWRTNKVHQVGNRKTKAWLGLLVQQAVYVFGVLRTLPVSVSRYVLVCGCYSY